jgi:hypothetical protein
VSRNRHVARIHVGGSHTCDMKSISRMRVRNRYRYLAGKDVTAVSFAIPTNGAHMYIHGHFLTDRWLRWHCGNTKKLDAGDAPSEACRRRTIQGALPI